VAAKAVVLAAGAWTDEMIRRFEIPMDRPVLRRTKGVHIVLPRERLPLARAITLISPIDGRVMFALPSTATTIIGTTDTRTDERPDAVRASDADIEYLLATANLFFPGAHLVPADVVAAWAGIRPLVASGFKHDAASASREHQIDRSAGGVISVSGGKLTTYRSMAAEVVDAVERALGRTPSRSPTDRDALPGGDLRSLDEALRAAELEVGDAVIARRLVEAHGSMWHDVAAITAEEPALARRLVRDLPYLIAEVVYAVEQELAVTLGDVLIRRLRVAYEVPDHGRSASRVAAAILAGRLGWDNARCRVEIDRYEAEVERIFGTNEPSA
jgi:glycerol-3-phosphate dehydrogenase